MTNWTFRKYTREGRPSETAVTSADHAVELLMKHSGSTEYGRVFEFVHAECGLVTCIASNFFSTLEFNPGYELKKRSRLGTRKGTRGKPVSKEPFLFEFGGQASSVDLLYVLPLSKVIRVRLRSLVALVIHGLKGRLSFSLPMPTLMAISQIVAALSKRSFCGSADEYLQEERNSWDRIPKP